MPLQTVTEVDVADPKAPIPPKASPKPKMFSLKRDTRSRSNSSGLNVRRFSSDSIFGERLDTIGRRLSRDMTYSPADLGRKFKTFGKESTNHSQENITDHYAVPNKFDTLPTRTSSRELLSVDMFTQPAMRSPRISPRRSPARSPVPERIDEIDSPIIEHKPFKLEKPKPPVRNRSLIPNFPIDSTKVELQNKLHEELIEKYGHGRKSFSSLHSNENK